MIVGVCSYSKVRGAFSVPNHSSNEGGETHEALKHFVETGLAE